MASKKASEESHYRDETPGPALVSRTDFTYGELNRRANRQTERSGSNPSRFEELCGMGHKRISDKEEKQLSCAFVIGCRFDSDKYLPGLVQRRLYLIIAGTRLYQSYARGR